MRGALSRFPMMSTVSSSLFLTTTKATVIPVATLEKPLVSIARPSCSWGTYLLRRRSTAMGYPTVANSSVWCRQVHIGHSNDVHRWRNPEKEEVQRQFHGGVKLGSHITKIREQEAREKELIEQDKFTDWRLIYNYALGAALLLIGLNVILACVEPNPSPEYVPYVEQAVSACEVGDTPFDSNRRPSGHEGSREDTYEAGNTR